MPGCALVSAAPSIPHDVCSRDLLVLPSIHSPANPLYQHIQQLLCHKQKVCLAGLILPTFSSDHAYVVTKYGTYISYCIRHVFWVFFQSKEIHSPNWHCKLLINFGALVVIYTDSVLTSIHYYSDIHSYLECKTTETKFQLQPARNEICEHLALRGVQCLLRVFSTSLQLGCAVSQ